MKTYDYIIIGSGWGAKLARGLADAGKTVAIIEKDKLGGTCLNRGCIPSKMFIHPADVMQEIRESKLYNIDTWKPEINFGKLSDEINTEIWKTSDSIKNNYESGNVKNLEFFHGAASFVENKIVEVNGQLLTAENIVIWVGSRPSVPPIEWLVDVPYMTSTGALKNKKLPKKLLVIWGGYIAVELGHAYGWFGTEVHFFVRSGLVWAVDNEIKDEFEAEFSHKYNIHKNITFNKVEFDKNSWDYTLYYNENWEELSITWDGLLIATGIKINSDTLNLDNTDLKIWKTWNIEVNNNLETNVDGIYAIWDCNGNHFFRHSVNFEVEYLLPQLLKQEEKSEINYPPMPRAIFSNPQVAGVGKTEEELISEWVEYFKWVNYYKNSAMWDALRSKHGMVKLLFSKQNQKLLWAHIVWPEASNMIHMLIVFINFNATLTDILKTVFIHPALPENIRNAARKAKINAK